MEKHTKCLVQACHNKNITYEILDAAQYVVRVKLNEQWQYFRGATTPFNDQAVAGLCKDKDHTYHILKDVVNTPKTISFVDFNTDEKYQCYVTHKNAEMIIKEVEAHFHYPVVIKKNQGSLGRNVFLCQNKEEIKTAITTIFDRNNKDYDYVLLAQEFIPTATEYRAVFYRQKLLLVYERYGEKSGDNKDFNCRYWETDKSQARYVDSPNLHQKINDFIQPIFDIISVNYVGFDLIIDEEGNLHFIEMNASPLYNHFIEDNGETHVTQIFEHILTQ